MKQKYLLILAVVIVAVIGGVFLIVSQQNGVQNRPTTLIFKLNSDYSGNYIGPINYYNDTNTYIAFGIYPLFDYCFNYTQPKQCFTDERTGEETCYGEPITKEYCRNLSRGDLKEGPKRLTNGYFAAIVPNSEGMIKRYAIFDKSILDIKDYVGLPESIEMDRDKFYSYVMEDHPLIEAYFCDIPQGELMQISSELANGEIDNRCKKIELGTFGKE